MLRGLVLNSCTAALGGHLPFLGGEKDVAANSCLSPLKMTTPMLLCCVPTSHIASRMVRRSWR